MFKWQYFSKTNSSNGYEDVLDNLKSYTKDKYKLASDIDKENMIKEILNIYRSKNIFPIQYYNDDGVFEQIQNCINKEVSWNGNILDFKYNQGSSLCRFLFPNILKVECGKDKRTLYNKFYDDYLLKRSIMFCLNHKNVTYPVVPTALKDGLEMSGGGVPKNFKPMNAKALYERYCPKNGIIYDYACGFGGRMLGALTSKNNYTYIGVEPNIETYTYLNKLGLYIEHVTKRNKSYKVYCMGSEDFMVQENHFDFAFSSPPYFNLEKYSNEPTQCYNRFPELEQWFIGYVKPTIENTYKMLKPNSYYAVNIADFKVNNKIVQYVDRWVELCLKSGFKFKEQIFLKLETRRGDGHKENNKYIEKKESVYLFIK